MMQVLHLLWIIPLSAGMGFLIGFMLAALISAGKEEDTCGR